MATYSKDFIVKNGLQVGGHILPDDNETYDLGSASKKFRDLYLSAGTIYLGSLVLKDNGDGTVATYEADGVTAASIQANAVDIDYDNTVSGMTADNVKAALDELMAAVEAIDTAGELAYDNTTSGLTATTVKGAIDEIVAEEDQNVRDLLANLDGNIIPSADITYDLGSPTKQWRDLYVGPGSLYLNGTKILEDDSGTLKFHADPAQSLSIQTSTTGSTSIAGGAAVNITTSAAAADIALTPTGDIELNADVVIGAGQALTTSNGSALTVNSNLDLGSNTVTASTFYGNLTGNISASSGTTTMNNLVVDGNLTVGGTTTTVNTETINLADNIITLNSNATGSASQNAGIEIERGDDTNVTLRWNETTDTWEVTEDGLNYKAIILAGDSITGDTSGNAATATALETSRTIGGVSFDGTANINLPGVNTAGNQDTSGNAATATLASSATALATARTIGGVSFDGTANINLPGVNTAGNQDTSGNAATATALETARTIGLSGDVSGSVSFDGSANATITATVADNSHSHTIANVTGLQTALDAAFVSASASNDTITFTNAGGTTSSVTISDAVLSTEAVQDVVGGMVSTNSESGIAVTYDDTNGKLDFNVSDPTITLDGAVTGSATMTNLGNVTITTTATSDPTLTLSGDASGSATFTNLGNATLAVTVANDSHNHSSSSGNFTVGGDLTVSGGDIVLSGTGRIQGVDTVSAGTDAANKTYVDTAISNLVNGADAAYDTLKEIQDAMATDTELANAIAGLTNVATADSWTTARTISLAGDASGSVSIDGSANATLTVTVADDSHNHTTSNIDNFTESVQDIAGGMWSSNSESGVSVTYQDTDGTLDINVNDPTITLTGAVTGSATMTNLGNVSIATTATADPTLTINGDASGSATFTNLGNATLTLTVANDSHTHDGRYYTETELSANGTGRTTSGAYKIGTYDEFGNSNSTNVQDVLDDLDAAISTALGKDPTLTINGDASGSATFTNLGNATLTLTIADDSHNHTTANIDNFTESVQDIIGGMVSSNTESGIGVTYNDSTGKLDFSVTAAGVVTAGSNLSYSGSTLNVASSPTFSGTVTAADFNSTSDERLKTNIETITDSGSKVAALRGVNFDWKESGAKTMGVIAQEVEAVIPEVVATDEEGMKSVNYQAMVGLLIEAVKELQEKVDAHEAKCECGK